jgi:hypothetical protein
MKKNEGSELFRILHRNELCDIYMSPIIIRIVNSMLLLWTWSCDWRRQGMHAECWRRIYLKCWGGDRGLMYVRMGLRETGREDGTWIDLDQDYGLRIINIELFDFSNCGVTVIYTCTCLNIEVLWATVYVKKASVLSLKWNNSIIK